MMTVLMFLMFSSSVIAQDFNDDLPPEFSEGEVYVIPTVDEQEAITVAQRLAKCGAYQEIVTGGDANFPKASFRIMTEISSFHPDKADAVIDMAFEDQYALLKTMDAAQIARVAEECDNLASFKDDVIAMEREIYE